MTFTRQFFAEILDVRQFSLVGYLLNTRKTIKKTPFVLRRDVDLPFHQIWNL